ncbi:MAG: siphovirus Gp157 family protein [Gemmatimonadota bacterium]
MTEKVRRVALVILNLTASAKAAHAEAERIAAMARSYERQTESLKRYLMFQLERAGTSRVETPTVKVRIQKNTRPSIRLVSADIPEQFRRVRVW